MAGWLMDPSEVHVYTRETDISSSRELIDMVTRLACLLKGQMSRTCNVYLQSETASFERAGLWRLAEVVISIHYQYCYCWILIIHSWLRTNYLIWLAFVILLKWCRSLRISWDFSISNIKWFISEFLLGWFYIGMGIFPVVYTYVYMYLTHV